MLFVNNEEVKQGHPSFKKYEAWIRGEFFKSLKNPVVLKSKDPVKFNFTGLVEPPRIKFVPFEAIVYDEDLGSQHWHYCEALPTKRKDTWRYRPLGEEVKRTMKIDKTKSPDKVFFMLTKSSIVKEGYLVLEDKAKEARAAIQKESDRDAVKYIINNQYSPISPETTGDENDMRMIASAWGVANAFNKDISVDEIRIDLFSKVEYGQKNIQTTARGFKEFLAEIHEKSKIALRANIQKAIDDEVIEYDKVNFVWKYKKSGVILATMTANYFHNPELGLFEYFFRHADKRKLFFETLPEKYELDEADKEPRSDDGWSPAELIRQKMKSGSGLADIDWGTFRRGAIELGVTVGRRKKEDIQKDVLEKISQI